MKSLSMTFVIICSLLLMTRISYGQKVTLLNSTEQQWSGGIAGRSGTNYTFSIRFEKFKQAPAPDTIWMGSDPVPILLKDPDSGKPFNTTVTRSKKTIQFDISAGISRDEYSDRSAPYPGRKMQDRPKPPREYTGVAMLVYRVGNKKQHYVVRRIMRQYPPVNYP